MAAHSLVPDIHFLNLDKQGVNGRDKPGHDNFVGSSKTKGPEWGPLYRILVGTGSVRARPHFLLGEIQKA